MIARTSSTRTRRGGSCLKDIYIYIYIRPFSYIELACAVRQPSPSVRALCESGVLLHMSHLKLHFALHTSHCTLHTPHFTLHSSHFTLNSSHSTLHTWNFTVHTFHFSLLSSHSTIHTALFTLHTELLLPYPRSSHLMCHLSFHESPPSTATKELACTVRQPGPCVRAFCESRVLLHFSHLKLHFALHTSHCTLHTPRCNLRTLHTSHCTLHTAPFAVNTSLHTVLLRLHTSHSTLHTDLFSSHFFSYAI